MSGDDPHDAGTIVNLKCTASHCSEGISNPSGDADLFARITARVAVQFSDADGGRTPGKKNASRDHQEGGDNPIANCEHTFLQERKLNPA
jgi:hypothetical protein